MKLFKKSLTKETQQQETAKGADYLKLVEWQNVVQEKALKGRQENLLL